MRFLILFFYLIVIFTTSINSQTIYVSTSGNNSDGSSWTNAYTSLQTAISAAVSGNQIWVAKGTYKPTNGSDRTISFKMKNNVAIFGGFEGIETDVSQRNSYGPGQENETILSGNIGDADSTDNSYNVIFNEYSMGNTLNNNASIDGFTISGGYANGSDYRSYGSGINNYFASPVIVNCTFKYNYAESGGAGISNSYSSPQILGCTFIHNRTNYGGGGICSQQSSSPTIIDCSFRNNYATYNGGGVQNYYSNAILINCNFSSNSTNSNGGGLQNYGGNPQINDCIFIENSSLSGGGIQNCEGTTATITNCTFSGNSAPNGGGMYNNNSAPVITGCTFINNSSAGGMGGYGGGMYNSGSTLSMNKCLFMNNTATRNGGGMRIQNSAVSITNSVFTGNIITETGAVYGGGICYNSSITITNCTFTDNTAYDGSALFNESSDATATVRNCIIWGNHIGDPFSSHITDYYNKISIVNSCIEGGFAGTGNIDSDPQFVGASASAEHPYSIQSTSPCADAGNNEFCSEPTDLKGDDRKLLKTDAGTPGTIDMGAYEFCTSNPLPVELITFAVSSFNGGIELKWQTATELNNYGFEIERLQDCKITKLQNWETIGFVEGNGNSNSLEQYSFVDANPPAGNLQYRLKQIDTDGSFEYYPTIAEISFNLTDVEEKQFPTEFALEQNYPNPFNPETVISYTIGTSQLSVFSNASLKIYDILGNELATLVNEYQQPGYYNVRFNGSNLSSGIYIYRLTAGTFTSTKKLMLMK